MNRVLKKSEASAECKKSLEEALVDKEEVFRKTMMEALEKQLKEIHQCIYLVFGWCVV